MKRILLILLTTICSFPLFAQEASDDSVDVQAVVDACVVLRDAAVSNDTAGIRLSSNLLKAFKVSHFSSLDCLDDTVQSLNGHLLFNPVFADSLAEGKDVYSRSDNMNRLTSVRGQMPNGSVYTKTCFVKAGRSTKYSFLSRDRQILAVVAEAGGRLTMKIHAWNGAGFDKRFNDTTDVYTGRAQRKASFQLPHSPACRVELEVVNCSNKDTSFAIISN